MRRWIALALLGLITSACGYDYTPPDTRGGFSSEHLVRVFERECVDEEPSMQREIAEATRGSGCFGDSDCEPETRGYYEWTPIDAADIEIAMQSDAHMLSQVRGDGWHCSAEFWRRPDDAFLDRLSRVAAANDLPRHEIWEDGEGSDHTVWHVWLPTDSDVPELRLIQLERPKPWRLLYVE
jgi:hypothetical protein